MNTMQDRVLGIRAAGRTTCLFLLAAAAMAQDISGPALQQIGEILAQKANFTAAQKKMGSPLVFAAKAARNELTGTSFVDALPPVQTDTLGRVTVDIRGTITPALLNQIQNAG